MAAIPLAALLAVAAPATAAGQSFLGFRSLGYPVLASDGRTAGVGNLGIGLAGTGLSASDPAAAARLALPTISLTMQPTWGTFDIGDESGSTNTTRFPLIAIGFPFPQARGVATVSLAGYMEQRWAGERTGTIDLGGRQVHVEDSFETNGGASVARLGWSQRVGWGVSVGVTAGAYVGRLEQFFDRALDTLAVPPDVRDFYEERRWRYGGYNFAAGLSLDPHELIHLAGTVEWSGDITEHARPGTVGEGRYSVPLRFSGGATARLTPRLSVNGSVLYQDWSAASGFPDGALSTLTLSYGGGVEWAAVRQETRSLPVRVGYRRVAPPFRYGRADPVESIMSLGRGDQLPRAGGLPLRVDRSGGRARVPYQPSADREFLEGHGLGGNLAFLRPGR